MSYFREVCRCVNCKKVYPDGIPTVCHKCGAKLGEKVVLQKSFLEKIELNLMKTVKK